jgi:hypothetical protein
MQNMPIGMRTPKSPTMSPDSAEESYRPSGSVIYSDLWTQQRFITVTDPHVPFNARHYR